jgi:hypothetical protein
MAFKAAFVASAPDADLEKHRCVVDTGMYKLYVVVVRNHAQALEACRQLVQQEGVHSILLCPGHSHSDVAEIAATVGKDVSVSVARGDNQSGRAAAAVMEREGWFAGQPH